MSLSASALQAGITASADAAQRLGAAVNIGIVDSGGNLAAFLRMPGAFLASIDIAIDKAWTANSFGMATSALGEMLDSAEPMVRAGLLSRPRLAAFPGGQPIKIGDVVRGAIGVSGGSASQDDEIALAGLMALMEQ